MQNEREYRLDNNFAITTKDLEQFDPGTWLEDNVTLLIFFAL